ncbi:MAG: sensor histidine kinase [Bradymonadia bacterium]
MPLRRRLIVYIGLVASVLVIGLGTIVESIDFERLKRESEQRDRNTLYFIESELTDAMVAKDTELIDSIVSRIVERETDIVEISVLGEQNQQLSQWRKERPSNSEKRASPIHHRIQAGNHNIGQMILIRDLSPLYAATQQRGWLVRLTLIGVVILIVGIVTVIFRQLGEAVRISFSQEHVAHVVTTSTGDVQHANAMGYDLLRDICSSEEFVLTQHLPHVFGDEQTLFSDISVGEHTYRVTAIRLNDFDAVFLYFADVTENTVLRSMPKHNPNPVLKLSVEGEITYANPASVELLNLWKTPIGSIVPRPVKQAIPKDTIPVKVPVNAGPRVYELNLVYVPVLEHISVYANDMTHIVELEAAKEKLLQREKLASLGGLVAGVAHELNTPLGVALTAAKLLEDELTVLRNQFTSGKLSRSLFEEGLNHLEEIVELVLTNSNRAAKLIESFKGVAVDRANLEIRTLELVSYIEQVVRSLGPYLKGAKLDVQIAGSECELTTAAGAFAQVITNLLQNVAIHAYQNQGGIAHIRVRKAGSEWIVVEVEDFGRGIADDALKRVFEPLYTTRLGEGGSGLGLHLCYEMVEKKLFGSIELDSQVGQGTKFTIRLPITPPSSILTTSDLTKLNIDSDMPTSS